MKKEINKWWTWEWTAPSVHECYVHYWPLTLIIFLAIFSPEGIGKWAGHVVEGYHQIIH